MKTLILIAVLAALTASYNAAFIPEETEVYIEGKISLGDILFYEKLIFALPIPGTVRTGEAGFLGNSTAMITGLRITNPPPVPGNTHIEYRAANHITVTLTSRPGRGLLSRVQVFGHYTDRTLEEIH